MGNMFSEFRNLGKQIAGCLCCALCLGPILIIVGIAFLVASTNDTRATELRQYNVAVDNWNSNVYQFQNATFNVYSQLKAWSNGDGIQNPGIWSQGLQLVAWTFHPADPLNDSPQNNEKFNPYVHLDYGWPLGGVQGIPPPFAQSRINTNQIYDITIKDQSGNTLANSLVYPFWQTAVPLTGCSFNDYSCLSSACLNKGAYWDSSLDLCSYFYQLSSICLKVHPKNAAFTQWETDFSLGATDYGGCSWSNYIQNAPTYFGNYNSGLQPLAYTRIPSNLVNHVSFWNLETITFNVRFYADPWIAAQFLTKGSLDFGLTVKQKFEVGIACLVAGVAITGILLCIAYSCIRKQRGQDQNYYKVTETQTTYGGGGGMSGGPMVGQPVMGQPVYGGSGPGMYAQQPMGGGGYPAGQPNYQQQY